MRIQTPFPCFQSALRVANLPQRDHFSKPIFLDTFLDVYFTFANGAAQPEVFSFAQFLPPWPLPNRTDEASAHFRIRCLFLMSLRRPSYTWEWVDL